MLKSRAGGVGQAGGVVPWGRRGGRGRHGAAVERCAPRRAPRAVAERARLDARVRAAVAAGARRAQHDDVGLAPDEAGRLASGGVAAAEEGDADGGLGLLAETGLTLTLDFRPPLPPMGAAGAAPRI